MQVVGAAAMEPPAGGDPATLKTALCNVFRAMPAADPTKAVRGQYGGYLDVEAALAGARALRAGRCGP